MDTYWNQLARRVERLKNIAGIYMDIGVRYWNELAEEEQDRLAQEARGFLGLPANEPMDLAYGRSLRPYIGPSRLLEDIERLEQTLAVLEHRRIAVAARRRRWRRRLARIAET